MVKIDFASRLAEPSPEKSSSKLPLLVVLLLLIGGGVAFFILNTEESAIQEVQKPVVKEVKPAVQEDLKEPVPPPQVVEPKPENVTPAVVAKEELPAVEKKEVKVLGPEIPVNLKEVNSTIASFISILGKKATGDLGFSNIVLKGSKFFYIRGLAANKGVFNALKTGLAPVIEDSQMPSLKTIGAGESSVDFTLYGKTKVQDSQQNPTAIAEKDIGKLVKRIEDSFNKKTKASLKLRKTQTQNYDRSNGHLFEARVQISFDQLNAFLRDVAKDESPYSLAVLNLKADDSESMNTHFTFEVFTKK